MKLKLNEFQKHIFVRQGFFCEKGTAIALVTMSEG